MIHHEQVSVLSLMHLQQAEEVKTQSQEIRCLLALVQEQQEAIKPLTELASPQSPSRLPRAPTSCSESGLDDMWEEIFNLVLGTVNTRQGTAVASHSTTMATPTVNIASFEDMLAEGANYTPGYQPRHVRFVDTPKGGLTSTLHTQLEEVAIPSRPVLDSQAEEIGLHVATREFRKNAGTKNQ